MAKTGELCRLPGVYEGECGHTHRFDVGDLFTRCSLCDRAVTWTWVGV